MHFIIECNPLTEILHVHKVSEELSITLIPGKIILNHVETGSKEKFTRFLEQIAQDKYALEWEIFFDINNESKYLLVNGFVQNENIYLIASDQKPTLSKLSDNFLSKTDHFSDAINIEKETFSNPYSSRPDQELFDDISALNVELATLQRELSKKQVQLEKMNETISQYAENLEILVEEKTKELAESEAKFRGIFENSSLGIAITDTLGNVFTCNHALKKIIGIQQLDTCVYTIPDIFFPQERERFDELINQLVADQNKSIEMERKILHDGFGGKWVNINIYSLELQDATHPNIIYIIEDITRRKQNELALLQSEKLSAVGKLAASLAHEINNPLQAMMGYLGLAKETIKKDDPISEYLDISTSELKRINNIVSDLRTVSKKPQIKEKKVADIDPIIKRVINITKKKAGEKNIQVKYICDKHLPNVLIDNEQITQVILNLIINAIDAIYEEGLIQITTSQSNNKPGITIKVSDTGPGIKQNNINNIFQPFFTTKKGGLGLGLHICKEIIDAHHGEISAENNETVGAKFTIWLPAAI